MLLCPPSLLRRPPRLLACLPAPQEAPARPQPRHSGAALRAGAHEQSDGGTLGCPGLHKRAAVPVLSGQALRLQTLPGGRGPVVAARSALPDALAATCRTPAAALRCPAPCACSSDRFPVMHHPLFFPADRTSSPIVAPLLCLSLCPSRWPLAPPSAHVLLAPPSVDARLVAGAGFCTVCTALCK